MAKVLSSTKQHGVHYTPPDLANFVARQLIAKWGRNGLRPFTCMDPAAGDGVLLGAIWQHLSPEQRELVHILAIEQDDLAAQLLDDRLKLLGIRNYEIRISDFTQEATGGAQQSLLFGTPTACLADVIIANPPYVRTQVLGKSKSRSLARNYELSGRVDLSAAFVTAILRSLAPDGWAGIIISNRFLTTRAGESVRLALSRSVRLDSIYDLGDTKLFSAAVLPAVVFATNPRRTDSATDQPKDSPKFVTIYETDEYSKATAQNVLDAADTHGLVRIDGGKTYSVRHGNLSSPSAAVWVSTDSDSIAWKEALSCHAWKTIGDVAKVRVGVKTTADKVFIRDDWGTRYKAELPELLRPLTTHHLACRFKALDRTESSAQILYPHRFADGKIRPVDINMYPWSAKYLESHRQTLESRTYLREAGRKWFEIWVPQNPSLWGRPKIVFRDICERPTFWIDLSGTIVNGDCYWISPDDVVDAGILWLILGVANSSFIEAYYDRFVNNKLYSGRRRFMTQYVKDFPIPKPESASAQKISVLSRQAFEAAHTGEIVTIERELDNAVWEAFGLTPNQKR